MSRLLNSLTLLLLFILGLALSTAAPTRAAATFAVNSTADVPDADTGNGVCETASGNGVCTLRAAIQEANALAGADTINLSTVIYILNPANGSLDITQDLTIAGQSPSQTIIDAGGMDDSTFLIVSGTTTMEGVTIQNSDIRGIEVSDNGTLTLANSIVSDNISNIGSYSPGGGIANSGITTITDSVISNNSSGDYSGGGIANFGTMTITKSSIVDNTAAGSGGGIANQGVLTITDSTIHSNTSLTSPFFFGTGGGIFNRGVATIRNSTIRNNWAAYAGGGIYISTGPGIDAELIVVNSTIRGNRTDGNGGGLIVLEGTVDLFNVTIVANIADDNHDGTEEGGGIFVSTGLPSQVNFRNTLLANNSHGGSPSTLVNDDCKGTLISQGYNLIEDTTGCTITGATTGNIIGMEPLLGPLAYNGGPTQTHPLQPDSPAIDAGNPGGCTGPLGALLTTDQRGSWRTTGAACDIGAFELAFRVFLPVVVR